MGERERDRERWKIREVFRGKKLQIYAAGGKREMKK